MGAVGEVGNEQILAREPRGAGSSTGTNDLVAPFSISGGKGELEAGVPGGGGFLRGRERSGEGRKENEKGKRGR